jgi:hypothetical protein
MSTGEATSGKVAVEGEDGVAEEFHKTKDILSSTTTGKWLNRLEAGPELINNVRVPTVERSEE